jgi:cell division septal protein FtsQ
MIITDLEKKMDDKKNIISITLLAGITIVFAGFFLCFSITKIITHIQLISNNQVSNEIIRKKDDNKDVFNKGCCGNWKEVFCDN